MSLTFRSSLRGLAQLVAGLIWLATLPAAQAAVLKFEIPAQLAPPALMLFAKQARAEVVFSADDLKAVSANAVVGEYEPEAALGRLLKDTGYLAQRNSGGKFVIKAAVATAGSVKGSLTGEGGKRLADVLVAIRETGQSSTTDRDGIYVFPQVAAGTYVLVAAAPGYQPLHITDVTVGAGRDLTLGQEEMRKPLGEITNLEPIVVHADAVTELETLEVTGARQKPFSTPNMDLPRTINDAKPYYVFNAETIEQTGAATVEDFLNKKLSMVSTFTSGSKVSAASAAPYSGTTSVMSLRGLSASQTLILMNGRRLPIVTSGAADGSPDLNSIPMSIIDHIEVLPSSASGIYGANAVGGVINIITKRNYTGGEIKLSYDNTFTSDSAKRRVDFTYGFSLEGDRTHVMIFASTADANAISVQDRYGIIRRNFARVAANNPAFFTGSNRLLGTTPRVDSSNGAPLVLKAQYGGQTLGSSFAFVPAGYRGLAADGAAGVAANAGKIDPEWPATGQYYNGRLYALYNLPQTDSLRAEVRRQMLPSLELFGSFSLDQNFMDSMVPVGAFSSQTGVTVTAAAPTNPFNQTVVVRFPTDEGVRPLITHLTRRGVVGGFSLKLPYDWQALGDYSWNTSTTYVNQAAFSFFPSQVNSDAAAGTFDPFIDLMRNPPGNSISKYLGTSISAAGQRLREATLRGAGPLPGIFSLVPTMAVGLQHRDERRNPQIINSVIPASPELNSLSGALGARQAVDNFYAELTVPLVPRERTRFGLRLLELQLTGRQDQYTTSVSRQKGTTDTSFTPPVIPATDEPTVHYRSTNPTYGVRYKPVEDLMFRASFANGFVPPTVTQLIPGIPSTTATNLIDPRRGGTPFSVIANPVGGNANLVPETSKNWAMGLVFTPKFLPGFRLAVDYQFIKKRNNISTLGAQVIVNNEALFPDRVTRGPVPAGDPYGVGPIVGLNTTALNLHSTAVEAYDISLGYQFATATLGTFAVDALGTVTEHYLQRITFGAPLLEYVGTPSAGGPLKFRGNFTATWSYRRWQLGWTTTYYDDYKVSAAPFTTSTTNVLNNGGPTVPSQIYHDVFVRYRFGSAGSGEAGWRHLLDRTELLVGVRNVFNKEPAFDGTSITGFFMSPYGDARMASYYLSLKRAF